MALDMNALKGKTAAELIAIIAAQDKAAERKLSLKVSDKGGVSLYGINARFPVTLYKGQWLKVLDMADTIRAFIAANDAMLSQGKPPTA